MREAMTIGQLAKAAGVNVETVRYYQRRGLLKEPSKPPGGHRRYPPAVVEQLAFIRQAQQLGFSLEEVKQLQKLPDGQHRQARLIAEEKERVLVARMEQLAEMRRRLRMLIRFCNDGKRRGAFADLIALAAAEKG